VERLVVGDLGFYQIAHITTEGSRTLSLPLFVSLLLLL
jgi:hypothetical protein